MSQQFPQLPYEVDPVTGEPIVIGPTMVSGCYFPNNKVAADYDAGELASAVESNLARICECTRVVPITWGVGFVCLCGRVHYR